MNQKLYVYKGKTTFFCSTCRKLTTIMVADFLKHKTAVNLTCECPVCGFSQTALLERRNCQRKEIMLPGVYSRYLNGKRIEKAQILVMELSLSGLRFRPHMEPGFSIGDKIWIRFNLNDTEKTLIKKESLVVNINPGKKVGAAFQVMETTGPIGTFLFGSNRDPDRANSEIA